MMQPFDTTFRLRVQLSTNIWEVEFKLESDGNEVLTSLVRWPTAMPEVDKAMLSDFLYRFVKPGQKNKFKAFQRSYQECINSILKSQKRKQKQLEESTPPTVDSSEPPANL